MMPCCHSCPGLSPQMLIEAHFTTIPPPFGRVDFLPRRRWAGRTNSPSVSPIMRSSALIVVLFAALAGFTTRIVRAEAAVFRSFDGPGLTWQLGDARPGSDVLAHGCVGNDARQGSGSEHLAIVAPLGESLHFICPVGRLPVLDEFETRLWVKANRPGVTLAARVVLPRSIDTALGQPQTVLVPGGQCEVADRWQQLRLTNVPGLLEAQARILRMTPGKKIDTHEAFVDAIVLVVPGGAGSTAVWTDALEVDGVVTSTVPESTAATRVAATTSSRAQHAASSRVDPQTPNAAAPPQIRFQGTMLLVEGKPFFPLGIEWNDEPLEYLAARGCNTIWTDERPTRELSEEAARVGVWLVCRPPSPDEITEHGLGDALQRVLAWNLGSPAGPQELDYFRHWADLVRGRDPLGRRPIVVMPRGDWLPASRLADALVADHEASSRLPPKDFAEWLGDMAMLARPGTPFWASIPTQASPRARSQAAALADMKSSPQSVLDDAQMEWLVTAAATSGCRGIVFRSDSPLDAADDATRRRAVLLEQLTSQLDLLYPWLTAGKSIGTATSTDSSATATVLQVERARVLIPTSWNDGAEKGSASSTSSSIVFIVPGIPESNEAFRLSGASLESVPSKRVAGGMRVVLDRRDPGLVLLTEDPTVIASFRQRVTRGARRAAQLQYSLASTRARALSSVAPRLSRVGASTKPLDRAIGVANSEIAQANSLLAAGNFDASCQRSSRARRLLAEAIAEQRLTDADSPHLNSVPFGTSHDMLVPRAKFSRSLAALLGGENQLIGGDFEDLGQLRHYGWEHVDDPMAGIATRVELSGQEPHEGCYCLQLTAAATPAGTTPQVIGRPFVWITSPPVRAMAGDVIEVSGWVCVPQPIAGSVDGLEIIDSLGGQELALRVRSTSDWQPFRLIRSAVDTTDFTVTFALNGVGTACVDGVMVQTLDAPTAKRLPTVTSRPGPDFPSAAGRAMFAPPRAR